MTATYYDVKQVYSRNYGSERLYKRDYCNTLTYTEGLKDFQETLSAYWVIDNMISYIPKVLQAFKENELDFFVVEICLNKQHKGYMEVFSEGYVAGEYKDYIGIIKQEIEYIDLPIKVDEEFTTYKFFLELSAIEPVVFTMLLPSEH